MNLKESEMDMNKESDFTKADKALDNFIRYRQDKPKKPVVVVRWIASIFENCLGLIKELLN